MIVEQFHFTAADRERYERQQAFADRCAFGVCALIAVLMILGVV